MKPLGDVLRHIRLVEPIRPSGYEPPLAPQPACAICNDAGYLRRDVPPSHPSFGKLMPCECKVREQHERLTSELSNISNLDMFPEHTFDHFDPAVKGLDDAFQAARDYAANPEGWLFLHGGVGTGKTHLAVAIAKDMMARRPNSRVLFAVVPDLLDHLRATFDPSKGIDYDERFEQIRGADLLILDDLGTENTTPWAREKLFQIFNHRYNEQSATVVTSNHDIYDIEDRVRSRLLDQRLTTTKWIDADDFRRPSYLPAPPQRRGRGR